MLEKVGLKRDEFINGLEDMKGDGDCCWVMGNGTGDGVCNGGSGIC